MPNLARSLLSALILTLPIIGCSPAPHEVAEKVSGEKVHFTDLAEATEPTSSLIRSIGFGEQGDTASYAAVDLNNDTITELLVIDGTEKECAQKGCRLSVYSFEDYNHNPQGAILTYFEDINSVQEVGLGTHYSEEFRDLILKTKDEKPEVWQWHEKAQAYCPNCWEK